MLIDHETTLFYEELKTELSNYYSDTALNFIDITLKDEEVQHHDFPDPLKSQSLPYHQTSPPPAVIKRRQSAHSASFNGLGRLNLTARDTA